MNFYSIFLNCEYAIARFLSQSLHPSGSEGWIINTVSLLGLVGLRPSAAAYCASKGTMVLLTKGIAVEYGGICCNTLCPGCEFLLRFHLSLFLSFHIQIVSKRP